MHKGQERIVYLDGLRGLAILLVLLWHYLGPIYAMHLPYGTTYAWMPVIRHGWAGVNLFFLISGYVIFLTLERCSGFVDFMLRRWLRLFPAMLLGSLLIFAAAQVMSARMPGGQPRYGDLLPGLTLINPYYFNRWLALPVRSLDGAFWSLYVEAAFYVVIGILFFAVGWARAIAGLLLLWGTMLAMPPIAVTLHAVPWLRAPYQLLHNAGVGYFPWFASGALFLKARADGDRGLFWMAVAIGLCASATSAMPDLLEKQARLAMVASVLLFAAVQHLRPLQRALETRALMFLGFVSYPLYLVHSAIGVGLIAVLAAAGLHRLAAALLVTAAMLALAWTMARWLEPVAARLLRPLTDAARGLLHVRASSTTAHPPGAPA